MPQDQASTQPAAWTRAHTAVFAAGLAMLAAVPWLVRHWPSQDGPNHLAVVHVVRHYDDPGSPFPQYVTVTSGLRPSALQYQVLEALARVMPLGTAEKVMVSFAIVLLPLALLLLVRRIVPARAPGVLLTLPFAIGWMFGMGFLSFILSMGFGVATLALEWTPPGEGARVKPRHLLAAAVFFVCVLFHPVAAVITGLAMLLLEGRRALRPAEWPRLLVVFGPAAVFLVQAYLRAPPSAQSNAAPLETDWAGPLEMFGGLFEYHVAYSLLELVPRVLLLVLLVRFAWRELRSRPFLDRGPEAALTRIVAGFFVLYLVTPHVLQGWFYCSARFLMFASFLLPAAAALPARVARSAPAIAGVFTLAVTGVQLPDLVHTSRQMQDIVDVGAGLPRGSKVIPMDFTARLFGPQPLGHSWAQLVVERDAIASQLFAAGKPRMGGEKFRTLSFLPGELDVATGKLPWSTYETWYDVVRACRKRTSDECTEKLGDRTSSIDKVIDRYDYVLMLEPPDYAQQLVAPHAELHERVGSAWLYAVRHDPSAPEPARAQTTVH